MGRQAQLDSIDASLRHQQLKHARLLARVEKTTARLERRRAKLLALEARIAELERQSAEPRREHPYHGVVASRLRPAQLIFNPAAGGGDADSTRLGQIVSALRAHGIDAAVGIKTSSKAVRQIARDAIAAEVPLIVVAGGDGTVEEVAAEIVGKKTVLGIIPIGTMNNVARSLGVPLDIDQACALLGMGTLRHIDVGRVFSDDPKRIEYFLEGAGLGLSALAAFAGQGVHKHRWHLLPQVMRRLFDARANVLRIAMDDEVIEVSSRIVTVSNAPIMGANLAVAPDARMDDGLLDVIVYDGMGEAALVKHFMAALSPAPERLKTYRTRHVRISASDAVHTHSDKDVTSPRRIIDIEIAPRALAVIAGNGVALSVPVESAPAYANGHTQPAHTNGHTPPAYANGVTATALLHHSESGIS